MKTNKYIPNPVDTSDIQLPEELTPLLEAMAKNVHERNTSVETLKLILKLGFKISK